MPFIPNSHDHERHERVRRQPANRCSTPQEQGIKNQHKGASQKAELFTEHAKDKVRMFFGQKGKVYHRDERNRRYSCSGNNEKDWFYYRTV